MSAPSRILATNSTAGSTPCSCNAPWVRGQASRLDRSVGHEFQTIDRSQHAVEFVAAPHDQTSRGNHAIGALPASKFRIFFDAIERHFGGAAEHREDRAVSEKVDCVI